MRFKLIFDRSIDTDIDIPSDIVVNADNEDDGFEALASMLDELDPNDVIPIEDVLCDSRSVKDDFDYYLFNAH